MEAYLTIDASSLITELQLDEKPSVVVDYGNGGGDEIRLVNAKKRIYLGRSVYAKGSSSMDRLALLSMNE